MAWSGAIYPQTGFAPGENGGEAAAGGLLKPSIMRPGAKAQATPLAGLAAAAAGGWKPQATPLGGGKGAAAAQSWGGKGAGAAAALGNGAGMGGGAIAEACEAAARGLTSGETVQDEDITVFDENDRPTQALKYSTFDECVNFPPQILSTLANSFAHPSQIQALTWPIADQGRDIIGIAATGSGKTLAFLLPAFADFCRTGYNCVQQGVGLVVLCPTRELAQQIEAEANRFGKPIGMWCVSMYGGSPKWDQMNAYRRGVHSIIACPGRLNDFLEGGQVNIRTATKLVLDEADRMLDMGFEPQIRKILAYMPPQRTNMFFSATWPREVRQLAWTILRQPYRVMIGNREQAKANQDIVQEVRIVDDYGKRQALIALLKEAGLTRPGAMGRALVFAATKRMCEELSQIMWNGGINCAAIHGDKEQHARDQALNGLRQGKIRVLCATDVAARGLDIKGIGLVVNFDVANNTEDHVHRIGRTGRAGAAGYAVTFVTRADSAKIPGIIKVMNDCGQVVPPELQALAGRGGSTSWRGSGGWGGGKGGGGGSKGPCVWCAKGECWTHKNGGGKGGGKARSRSPPRLFGGKGKGW